MADIVLGVAMLLMAGVLVREGLRRRKRLLYFYLRDLFVATGIIAAFAALYVSSRVQYRNELNILQTIDETKLPPGFGGRHWDVHERTGWQYCGPSWLRRLIGDQPFQAFDRVVGIETQGLEEIRHVATLKNLEVVRIMGSISNDQLRQLEQLPQLEALFLAHANITDEDGHLGGERFLRLPRLPKLRGLNLYGTAFRGDGLEDIPSVEVLDLCNTDVGDECVPVLLSLRKLKHLGLYETAITESGVRELRRGLPHCEIHYSPPWP